MTRRLALACCSAAADPLPSAAGRALQLNAEAGAPEWIQLMPAGRLVVGRDRRRFVINDPAAIIAATRPMLPLVIDYEHDFELRSPGQDTPAAGWIEDLEVRDGSIWGRVMWSDRAANAIAAREYRFISPVLLHHRDTDPMEVVAICSAGLTHRPNLDLKALNCAGTPPEDIMKDLLIKLLGLSADASEAAIVAAINALKEDHAKALNRAETPDPARFVPKAQLDETVAALNTAKTDLAARETADKSARADKLVDDAIAGGKLVPAVRDHYVGLALNNFEGTKAALDAMPSILAAGQGKVPVADLASGAVLTAEEKSLCSVLGLTDEAFVKARAA